MSEYLNKIVRVSCTDGRHLYGRLRAFTAQSDVILADAVEQQPGSTFCRSAGAVIVPGDKMTRICLQRL